MAMCPEHADNLMSNYTKLSEIFKTIIDALHNYLLKDKQVLTLNDQNEITIETTPLGKAHKLMDIMRNKGEEGYSALIESAEHFNLPEAVHILRQGGEVPIRSLLTVRQVPAVVDHVENEVEEPLPEQWPYPEFCQEVLDETLLVKTLHSRPSRKYEKAMKGNSIYPMKSSPRGRAVIFSNKIFTNMEPRHGTDIDVKGLKAVFQKLGFCPVLHLEKNAEEMKNILERECAMDHQIYDCIAVVFMSHGDEGIVYGTDAQYNRETKTWTNFLELAWVRQQLNRILCGKPKLLFVQACQGADTIQGRNVADRPTEADAIPEHNSPVLAHNEQAVHLPSNEDTSGCRYTAGADVGSIENDGIGIGRDGGRHLYEIHATLDGFLAWRDPQYGSWFIQSLIYVLARYAYKCNVQEMGNKVSKLVSIWNASNSSMPSAPRNPEGGAREQQIICKFDTMSRDLYLFPGKP